MVIEQIIILLLLLVGSASAYGPSGGGAGSNGASLTTLGDVTPGGTNGTLHGFTTDLFVNPMAPQFGFMSNSNTSFTGTLTVGNTTVTGTVPTPVANGASGWKNGMGVMIPGAGTACSINSSTCVAPSAPTVAVGYVVHAMVPATPFQISVGGTQVINEAETVAGSNGTYSFTLAHVPNASTLSFTINGITVYSNGAGASAACIGYPGVTCAINETTGAVTALTFPNDPGTTGLTATYEFGTINNCNADGEVRLTPNMEPMLLTTGTSAAGKYKVSITTNDCTYTFNSGDASQKVDIIYTPVTAPATMTMNDTTATVTTNILSLSESGTTVTVTLASACNTCATSDAATISNAPNVSNQIIAGWNSGYNGAGFTITKVDTTHFTYTATPTGLLSVHSTMAVQLAVLDSTNHGITPASTAGNINGATLSGFIMPGYVPLIYSWSAVTGAYGYLTYCSLDGGTAYWCGGTYAADNTISDAVGPLTWADRGTNTWTADDIPVAPPASAVNEDLITTASSIVGGTSLVLAVAPSTGAPATATVFPDDTAVFQSAMNFCSNASTLGCTLLIPSGKTRIQQVTQVGARQIIFMGQSQGAAGSQLEFWGDGGGTGSTTANGDLRMISDFGCVNASMRSRNSMTDTFINLTNIFTNIYTNNCAFGVGGGGLGAGNIDANRTIGIAPRSIGGKIDSTGFYYFKNDIAGSYVGATNGLKLLSGTYYLSWPGLLTNAVWEYTAGNLNDGVYGGTFENDWNLIRTSHPEQASSMSGMTVMNAYNADHSVETLVTGSLGKTPQPYGVFITAVGNGWQIIANSWGTQMNALTTLADERDIWLHGSSGTNSCTLKSCNIVVENLSSNGAGNGIEENVGFARISGYRKTGLKSGAWAIDVHDEHDVSMIEAAPAAAQVNTLGIAVGYSNDDKTSPGATVAGRTAYVGNDLTTATKYENGFVATVLENVQTDAGGLSEAPLTLNGALGALTSAAAATLLQTCVTVKNAGHFNDLNCSTDLNGSTCTTTAPAFNVRDNTAGTTGTAKSCSTTAGNVDQAETLAFSAGDVICIVRTTNGSSCSTPVFGVTAQYKEP